MKSVSLPNPLTELLDIAIAAGASDVHIMANTAPCLRVNGVLKPVESPPLTAEASTGLLSEFIGTERLKVMEDDRKEQDFAFGYKDLRFRTNVFWQKGSLAAAIRILPKEIKTLEELGIPEAAIRMTEHNQGLIIVAGPTGHGKSTTLAAMLQKIAAEREGHIITIEDPVEYVFEHKRSIIAQREVGQDTPSFSSALRTALREDPDVVLVGEMRDLESIEAALQLAQTGHLVLTTLHTNSAAQTANRIIEVFPPHQQDQVRIMLAETLVGILSQRLLPKVQGGRMLATELMLANSAVGAIIREGKSHQLPNLIQTSAAEGMVGLDNSLAELVRAGHISIDDAMAWSLDPKALRLLIY